MIYIVSAFEFDFVPHKKFENPYLTNKLQCDFDSPNGHWRVCGTQLYSREIFNASMWWCMCIV